MLNKPDEKIECRFCDYYAKLAAMLNHYEKKHSFEQYYIDLQYERTPEYLRK